MVLSLVFNKSVKVNASSKDLANFFNEEQNILNYFNFLELRIGEGIAPSSCDH